MPELPDVAVFKRYFDATALHQKIEDVEVRDVQVLANVSASELASRLKGHAFTGTSRHGKYLFARLDDGDEGQNDARSDQGVLVLHFGMTGFLHYYKKPEQEPDYTRFLCTFRNQYHLAYSSSRKLGEIRLIQDVDAFIRAKKLGPDVLDDAFDFETFQACLAGRRGMIKTRLMDQQIMAGIGNVYSDEILFQARVHPETPSDELDEETLRVVFDKMKSVLTTAIDHDAEPSQFPDEFITPQREEGATCPRCGGSVARIKVSGRSSYFCPRCQEKPP